MRFRVRLIGAMVTLCRKYGQRQMARPAGLTPVFPFEAIEGQCLCEGTRLHTMCRRQLCRIGMRAYRAGISNTYKDLRVCFGSLAALAQSWVFRQVATLSSRLSSEAQWKATSWLCFAKACVSRVSVQRCAKLVVVSLSADAKRADGSRLKIAHHERHDIGICDYAVQ